MASRCRESCRLLVSSNPLSHCGCSRHSSRYHTVLGQKGFGHVASRHGKGDWEILFTPGEPTSSGQQESPARTIPASPEAWPPAKDFVDNRGLPPPEPMIRILEALEQLAAGEVLEAINEREPMLLYPELEARGAVIQVEKRPDGTVRLLIRRGG